jgi:hypothetical protein
MTWQDLEEVVSLRQSARNLRDDAARCRKYPPIHFRAEELELRAAECDLRADEIERNLGSQPKGAD